MEGWVGSTFFNLGPILGPIFGACIVQFLGFQSGPMPPPKKKLSTQLLRNLTEHAANLAITAVGGMTQDTANERINQKTTIKWTGHPIWTREGLGTCPKLAHLPFVKQPQYSCEKCT